MLLSRTIEQKDRAAIPEWERGIFEPETHRAGPVRNIPVTMSMREADRRRAASVNPDLIAWRQRVLPARRTLPVAEPAPQPEQPPDTMLRNSSRGARLKPCEGHSCKRTTEHTSGKCYDCRVRESRGA